MSAQVVLIPVLVQVALTFVLLLWTSIVRARAIREGTVHMGDIALGQQNWPPRATQIASAYQSQFELPVLFYVLTILAWSTRQADLLFVVLAWVFIVLRLARASIQVTSNRVPSRFAEVIVLVVMWGTFANRLLFGLPPFVL
jgi:hypothetical protein